MPKLNSSNVDSVEYDKETRTLKVQFKTGAVYTYGEVSPQTYAAMLKTDSPGRFVGRVLSAYPIVEVVPAAGAHKKKK